MEASRATATFEDEANNQAYKPGASRPNTVGPRTMPPNISPTTAGCLNRRMIWPNTIAQASMAVNCSASLTKS